MKWSEFYQQFSTCPIITPQMVYAVGGKPQSLQVQIARWVQDGRLIKLSREKYVFSKIYQKKDHSLIFLANQLVYPSYVSLEYALSFYNCIPEAVFSVTSVTPLRPIMYQTPIGTFMYRHIKKALFWGYEPQSTEIPNAMIASPEKTLLDTFYFWDGPVTKARMEEMRFQNLDQIDLDKLNLFTQKTNSKKLLRIVKYYLIPMIEEAKKT